MAEPRGPEGDESPTPRWVYVVGSLVILMTLAFVVMHVASGGLVRH